MHVLRVDSPKKLCNNDCSKEDNFFGPDIINTNDFYLALSDWVVAL